MIKPLDAATVAAVSAAAQVVLTAENHPIIGGLGLGRRRGARRGRRGRPLRRVGLRDTFAEGAGTAPYLFGKYGLSTQSVVEGAWNALGLPGAAPAAGVADARPGEYSPV